MNSDKPEFWNDLYQEGALPWDTGRVPPLVEDLIGTRKPPVRVLIPGCGSAYEAKAFADAGWDVVALDFAPAAVERAKSILGPRAEVAHLGDFFTHSLGEPFDVIYERAFLCAMPPSLWPDYGKRIREVLKVGGELLGFFFYDTKPSGPPYGMKDDRLRTILGDDFERIEREPVGSSMAVFKDREYWEVWRRKRIPRFLENPGR